MREQQFTHFVCLLKMRIAREDKAVDTQLGIFVDTRRDGRAVTHQRSTCATAYQADTRPEIGADLQILAFAVM